MSDRAALILSDYGAAYPGSFIPSMRALADELARRGWTVELGFSSHADGQGWFDELREEGRQVSIAPAADGDEIAAWIRERLDARGGRAVVHTHFTAFELAALAAARGRADAAVIWHVHTYLTRRPLSRLARQLAKYGWLARRVDRIICVGAATAHEIRVRGGRGGRIRVIPNGIDTARFAPIEPAEREAARAELGLDPAAPVLLHFGWEWQGKGGPLFAQTLAELRGRGVQAIGLAVGGGEPARADAARLGLGDALIACEPRVDVRELYAAADALVATSVGEGGDPTFSILEALCCGIAVVGSDIPGHRVPAGGPAAVRNAPADPSPLADAAAQVVERQPAQREAEAIEAHDWVVANRGLTQPAREIADVYDELAPPSA